MGMQIAPYTLVTPRRTRLQNQQPAARHVACYVAGRTVWSPCCCGSRSCCSKAGPHVPRMHSVLQTQALLHTQPHCCILTIYNGLLTLQCVRMQLLLAGLHHRWHLLICRPWTVKRVQHRHKHLYTAGSGVHYHSGSLLLQSLKQSRCGQCFCGQWCVSAGAVVC